MAYEDQMPLSLAEKARRNLAVEDAGINRFNAVAETASRLPGIGKPGSTPVTDQTNQNIADAMERSDRGSRFGFGSPQYAQNTDTPTPVEPDQSQGIDLAAVNQRRNDILKGVDPDAPAIYVNPKRRLQLQSELGGLTNIVHQESLNSANQAHQDFIKHKDIETSQQFVNLAQAIRNHKAPLGTPEHDQEILDAIIANPLAAQTKNGQTILKSQWSLHNGAKSVMGFDSPETLLAKNPGAEYQQDPRSGKYFVRIGGKTTTATSPVAKKASTELAAVGATPDQFANRINVRATDADFGKVLTPTPEQLKEVESKRAHAGKKIALDLPDGRTVLMDRTSYIRLGGAIPAKANPDEFKQKPQAPTETTASQPVVPAKPPVSFIAGPNGENIAPSALPKVSDVKEYRAIPAGSHYVDPSGNTRFKPDPKNAPKAQKRRGQYFSPKIPQEDRLNPSNVPISGFNKLQGVSEFDIGA